LTVSDTVTVVSCYEALVQHRQPTPRYILLANRK